MIKKKKITKKNSPKNELKKFNGEQMLVMIKNHIEKNDSIWQHIDNPDKKECDLISSAIMPNFRLRDIKEKLRCFREMFWNLDPDYDEYEDNSDSTDTIIARTLKASKPEQLHFVLRLFLELY